MTDSQDAAWREDTDNKRARGWQGTTEVAADQIGAWFSNLAERSIARMKQKIS